MNKKLTIGICIWFLLVVSSIYGSSPSYETSSVSRLVGNSPEDLINQLDTEEVNLNHASYYGDDGFLWFGSFEDKRDSLNSLFDRTNIDGRWDYDDINLGVFESNELLIIEADDGSFENNDLKSLQGSTQLKNSNVRNWRGDFADHNPIFIFDSKYAGMALPTEDSFVNELTRYSQIIAPTFINSREFVRAFICNLGNNKTLGNSFREARNKYYATTNPNEDELVGLTLLSYHLYGNPISLTTTPNYDLSALKDYCGDLLGKKEISPFDIQSFTIQNVDENINEIISLTYAINKSGNYDILNLKDYHNIMQNYDFVRPQVVKHHDLPLGTIVTNISYNFGNPEIINLNLPIYDHGLTNRSCYLSNMQTSFDNTLMYKEDKQTINLFVNPLEMIDCNSGSFKLYKRIEYVIEYISPSPIYFDNLEYPGKILPNSEFDLTFDINYVNNQNLNGEIELFENDVLIYQKEMESNVPAIKISLNSIKDEKFTNYKLRYIENGTVLTESKFDIETKVLEYKLSIPEIIKGSAGVTLEIYNMRNSSVNVDVKDNLLLNNSKIQGSTNSYSLNSGLNQFNYNYNSLLQSDQKYHLQFDLGYENKQEVLNDIVVTNHKPILDPISDIIVKEGKLIEINVSALDLDEDSITYTISAPVGNDGKWQTSIGDEGEYNITITATDGYATDVLVVKIYLLPYNVAPILDDILDINVLEGKNVTVKIYAEDFDDNNLTYNLNDSRFIKIEDDLFNWQTQTGDEGNYTIEYSVFDGIDTVSKTFDVIVEELVVNNTNTTNTTTTGSPITKFVGGVSTKDLIYTVGESQTVYIKIPKNVTVTEARVDITGKEG